MQEPIIEIKNLTKRYLNGYALSEIDLALFRGEVHGIIGSSGAGKSTLFRCLTGLEKPTSGQIIVEGIDIATHSKEALRSLRKSVGMIFQHFNLFNGRTALENVVYPLEIALVSKVERYKRAKELLAFVGLEGKEGHYPSQLSGGQKQRVAIARALSTSPKILLCDEATSALDSATTEQIITLLKELNRKMGLTIILITHEMQVVKEICTSASVLSEGRVVESDSVSELFTHPHHPITKKLLGSLSHTVDSLSFPKNGEIIRLCFRGDKTNKPIISQLIKQYDVEVNILLGSIDTLVNERVGNLIIQLAGTEEECRRARSFLEKQEVYWEFVDR